MNIAVHTAVIRSEPIIGSFLDEEPARRLTDWAPDRARVDEAVATPLDVPGGGADLNVVIAAHQSFGAPNLTSRIVMPGNRHEIEDSYPCHESEGLVRP